MTLDEYKQWVANEMSQMPVSGWYQSTCVGGSLTITEECFERMKTDPEWENTVLGMVREMYSVNGIMSSKMISSQCRPNRRTIICINYSNPHIFALI